MQTVTSEVDGNSVDLQPSGQAARKRLTLKKRDVDATTGKPESGVEPGRTSAKNRNLHTGATASGSEAGNTITGGPS